MLKLPFSFNTAWRSLITLSTLFLAIEFTDEFIYGVGGAALPAQRIDLALGYAQVGMLLGLPHLVNVLVEPVLMLLGDTSLRKGLVVGGGLVVAAALGMTAAAPSFAWLLAASMIMFPASGAFVSLAQATLMDLNPGRESQTMARWVLSGSLANLAGPLFLGVLFSFMLGWRAAFGCLAFFTLGVTFLTARAPFPAQHQDADGTRSGFWFTAGRELRGLWDGLRGAVRDKNLLRWLFLLQVSDLMLDVLTSYMALYFSDVMGVSKGRIPFLVGAFTAAGLVSDLLVVYLLERFDGRAVLRFSAAALVVLYPAWLLAPGIGLKIGLALAVHFMSLGWYTIHKGEAFAAAPARKGTVLALDSTAGFFGGLLPWLVGWTAGVAGLPAAMWILLLGPVGNLVLLPKPRR